MKIGQYFNKQEYTIYAIVAVLLFLLPIISVWINPTDTDAGWSIIFHDIIELWKQIAVFLLAILIHDLFLAPLLVYKRKIWQYFGGLLLLFGVYVLYQINYRPYKMPPKQEMSKQMSKAGTMLSVSDNNSKNSNSGKSLMPPPPPVDDHSIMMFSLLFLGVGSNLGVKYYTKSISSKLRMDELEKENVEQKLLQLRYQIHPHFFMNTLNNIHALVDIDPNKAKESIIDLSKLMRYVLYESNVQFVQASREVAFMENYVRLMSIRYADKFKFTVKLSDDGVGVWIPPLVFISFVENAFKHGVDYKKESYIDLDTKKYVNDKGEHRLSWVCSNSKHSNKVRETGVNNASGVGLSNIRRRLDLLFGDNYTLNIIDGETEFKVEMDIPVYDEDPNIKIEDKN